MKAKISAIMIALATMFGFGLAAATPAQAYVIASKTCYVYANSSSTSFTVTKSYYNGIYTWKYGGQDKYVDVFGAADLWFDYYGAYQRRTGGWSAGTVHYYSSANGSAISFDGYFKVTQWTTITKSCRVTL